MIKFLLKLVVSSLLLFWVLSKTDLSSIGDSFKQCHYGFLLIAFSLHFVGLFITVIRWQVLYQAIGPKIAFNRLLKSYLVGAFFNTFLPSTVGGDVSRSLDFKSEVGGAQSFAVVFVERFTGLMAMVLMAAVALPFADKVIPEGFYISEMVLGMAILFALFVIVIRMPQMTRWLGQETKFARFHASIVAFSNHLRPLGLAFLLGILLQANVVLHYYFLCLGLGLDYSILYLFIIIPVLKVILLFPFSINGIGLRENAFAYFFQAKGTAVAAALALSWLDLGMVLAFSLIGGIVYVSRKQNSTHA